MAEGFARRYGADVMKVLSAGLSPASIVQPLTKKVMEEKNINIDDQFPKDLSAISIGEVDLIVNISGNKLPTQLQIEVRDWAVEDPIAKSEDLYLKVRDQIEQQVMRLILELRRGEKITSTAEESRPSTPLRARFGRPARPV
jgi:protein-tyrosine-phosphatase